MDIIKKATDFQVELQGVINELSDRMESVLSKNDRKILAQITETLRELIEVKQIDYRKLEAALKELKAARLETFKGIENLLTDETKEIMQATQQSAMAEIASLTGEGTALAALTAGEANDLLRYSRMDGRKIQDWFKGLAGADWCRIESSIFRNLSAGGTWQNLLARLRGTLGTDTAYGSFKTTSMAARTLARTCINGASNAARLEVFKKNADVIDGVQFLATLDSKTSKICAHYDRTVWKVGDKDIVTPPLHPNCRSVLIPYVKVLDENGKEVPVGTRAAERENFDLMAKAAYEKKTGKQYDALSYDYRKQLMYKQIKAYEAKTGQSAYVQMKGASAFPEYFGRRSAAFQKEWLGPTRYRMYADGSLKLDQLVNPDTGFMRTVKELKELVGG